MPQGEVAAGVVFAKAVDDGAVRSTPLIVQRKALGKPDNRFPGGQGALFLKQCWARSYSKRVVDLEVPECRVFRIIIIDFVAGGLNKNRIPLQRNAKGNPISPNLPRIVYFPGPILVSAKAVP